MVARKFLVAGQPYFQPQELPGKLIVIEGTDGVGRSVQVRLLKEWLEVKGYGVVETGWTRSALMAETIGAAKAGHSLNKHTFALLYATDFADRLEKEIIPALRSGFVVLADRYVYSAFARNVVRGVEPEWIRRVFGFAIEPDIVLYLRANIETLIQRVLSARKMDYWESGMDLRLGEDLFDCFRLYQQAMVREYARLAREYGFHTIDARLPVDQIQEKIRQKVEVLLKQRPIPIPTGAAPPENPHAPGDESGNTTPTHPVLLPGSPKRLIEMVDPRTD